VRNQISLKIISVLLFSVLLLGLISNFTFFVPNVKAQGTSATFPAIIIERNADDGVYVVDPGNFENNTYTLFNTGHAHETSCKIARHLYVVDSKLHKIDLYDFSEVANCTITSPDSSIDIKTIDDFLIISLGSKRLSKVNLSNFTEVDTTICPQGNVYYLETYGNHAYAIIDTSPIVISKLNVTTFTAIENLTLNEGEGYAFGSELIDQYLYFLTDDDPKYVVKVDMETFTRVGHIDLGSWDYADASGSNSTHLWACIEDDATETFKVFEIDLSSFALTGRICSFPYVNGRIVINLYKYGNYIYVIYQSPNSPIYLGRIDAGSFTYDKTIVVDSKTGYCEFNTVGIVPMLFNTEADEDNNNNAQTKGWPYIYSSSKMISDSKFSQQDLEFKISAEATESSTTEVYCGDKGKPHKVFIDNTKYNENDHWTYDESAKTLTVIWTHSSSATIKIKWKGGGLDLYNLHIKVTRDGFPTNAFVTIGHENRSVFGVTNFQLPYGSYQVTVQCGSESQRKEVGLYANTNTGFSFGSPKRHGKIPWEGYPLTLFFEVAQDRSSCS